MLTLRGACLCGKVRYEIKGAPRWMYQCHCGKCRAASGSSFATNIIVDADKFRISAGQGALRGFESSPKKFRYFCSDCGSPIYSHGEKTKQVVSVRCGTLKQDSGVRPAYHAFVASKAPWVQIADGLPQFDELPDPATVRKLMGSA
jgi:hypothetical protein